MGLGSLVRYSVMINEGSSLRKKDSKGLVVFKDGWRRKIGVEREN